MRTILTIDDLQRLAAQNAALSHLRPDEPRELLVEEKRLEEPGRAGAMHELIAQRTIMVRGMRWREGRQERVVSVVDPTTAHVILEAEAAAPELPAELLGTLELMTRYFSDRLPISVESKMAMERWAMDYLEWRLKKLERTGL